MFDGAIVQILDIIKIIQLHVVWTTTAHILQEVIELQQWFESYL